MGNMIYTNEICYCLHTGVADSYRVAVLRKQEGDNVYAVSYTHLDVYKRQVYGGMLNAVGLQNPGIELFCKRDIPFLKQFDTRIVVNVCGHSLDEYLDVVKRLADEPIDLSLIHI